jgi:hypothetical protein
MGEEPEVRCRVDHPVLSPRPREGPFCIALSRFFRAYLPGRRWLSPIRNGQLLLARPICLLMVDTDPDRLALVRGAMRRRADMMLTASSTEEAWRRLEQSALPIDWILVDVQDDGALSFATELRRRNPTIGILLTVNPPFASDFRMLSKPYGIRELWAAMA